MARARKDSVMRTFKLRSDLIEKLDKYSNDSGVPKTTIIEKALEQYFKNKKVD